MVLIKGINNGREWFILFSVMINGVLNKKAIPVIGLDFLSMMILSQPKLLSEIAV